MLKVPKTRLSKEGHTNMAKQLPDIGDYKYGFKDKDVSIFRAGRGLTKEIVEEISRERRTTVDVRLPFKITG